MSSKLNRRSFIKRGAAAAGTLSATSLLAVPNIVSARNVGDKIKCVSIGCGGRGMAHIEQNSKENLVAIVDVDEKRHDAVKKALKDKDRAGDKLQTFTDYRRMFDKLHKEIDAVFVATPNHHHALPTMIAMQLGKGVYCEKPLCHDISEARKLRAMAAQYKVPTQMGNQGHCQDGYRRLCEYVWAGVIGDITETHSWCDRSNGGIGPRPPTLPVPAGMNWDTWIGPAPYRDFHSDLHPHEWHGWYDFGNGSLGNLACHVMDGVYWALKLEHPTSIELESVAGGSDERYPTGTRIRWDFPARGSMPAVKAFWYDGFEGTPPAQAAVATTGKGKTKTKEKRKHYLPPLLHEMKDKYPDEKFETNGTLYVGDKGVIYTGCYGGDMHVLPMAKMKELTAPPVTLARPKDSFHNFLEAVREGRIETATPFDYGAQLTEFTLLGNIAQFAGLGHKVEWDGPNMKVTNMPELDKFLHREYRTGWGI